MYASVLRVECGHLHASDAIVEVHRYLPWIAADFAIFDVLLSASAAGVYADSGRLTAIRAHDFSRRLDCAVAERKFIVQVVIIQELNTFPPRAAPRSPVRLRTDHSLPQ